MNGTGLRVPEAPRQSRGRFAARGPVPLACASALRHPRTRPVSQVGKRGVGARLPSPDEPAEEVGEVFDFGGRGSGDLGLFVVAAEAEGRFPVWVGPEGGLLCC